jgi:hypothetical protein
VKGLSKNLVLRTPLDPSVAEMENTSKYKKLKPGRRDKHIGDYCLLAGTPQDAIRQYVERIAMCVVFVYFLRISVFEIAFYRSYRVVGACVLAVTNWRSSNASR